MLLLLPSICRQCQGTEGDSEYLTSMAALSLLLWPCSAHAKLLRRARGLPAQRQKAAVPALPASHAGSPAIPGLELALVPAQAEGSPARQGLLRSRALFSIAPIADHCSSQLFNSRQTIPFYHSAAAHPAPRLATLPSVAAEVQPKKGRGKAPGTVIDPSTMSLKAIIKCAHAQERIRLESERNRKVCCATLMPRYPMRGHVRHGHGLRPDVAFPRPSVGAKRFYSCV